MIFGLNLGLNSNTVGGITYNTLATRYAERVIANGGVVESLSCVNGDYTEFNWDYYFRVVDGGGVVESLECVTF